MKYNLKFDPTKYEVKTVRHDGQTITYRAFEHIVYVEKPVDEQYQSMNIFVPECYYAGEHINGYTLHTAPIFLPNKVGGYMPGLPDEPNGTDFGHFSTSFYALQRGYVVAAPGVRGRVNRTEEGVYYGKAPACIVDLKVAVRYLHANADVIPGEVEKIVSNGTSAGGALSSLLGATGNHPDYAPYLAQLGAADARDDIFAASCYCPITNLDHADMAYEWMYNGENTYHMARRVVENGEERFVPFAEQMSEAQIVLSDLAKPQFPAYLNSLGLKDKQGNALTLDESGEGSFKALVERYVIASAQQAREAGEDLSGIDWLKYEGDVISAIDFPAYVRYITRMKPALAFDGQSMTTPENDLFGNATVNCRHFTEFSCEHSAQKDMAEAQVIHMMNPMNYIGSGDAKVAPHWRIRHGEADRDTSLAIPVMLATKLRNAGYPVDFRLPWNVPHAGDYDLDELFAWIDGLARNS